MKFTEADNKFVEDTVEFFKNINLTEDDKEFVEDAVEFFQALNVPEDDKECVEDTVAFFQDLNVPEDDNQYVKAIVEAFHRLHNIDLGSHKSHVLMYLACKNGWCDIVKYLVEQGTDVNIKGPEDA